METMSIPELRNELERLQENLCDLQEMHDYTFGKTNVHIGAEKAQNLQAEYEEECTEHKRKIAAIESVLKEKAAE